jgi:glycine/D-amino acid oxidase-like deaminating enzyme
MKVAIIGAGFAGLATAYFLLESEATEVTVFEASRIGEGASGVASGLLHPYPGLSARRSERAEEALAVSKQLLKIAENYSPRIVSSQMGIFRASVDPEQHQRLLSHANHFGDVEHLEKNLFLIHSGITVLSENYLNGLASAIKTRKGEIIFKKIYTLNELERFDHIVLTAGYGIREFPECRNLRVKFLKGQALTLKGTPPHDRSYISKGYIASIGGNSLFEVGSTYERNFTDTAPHVAKAKKLLEDKLSLCLDAEIINCKAGVRVCSQGHYAPIIEQIAPNAHVFTGLGSRGLLYHGLYGRQLAQTILSKNKILS